MYTAELAVDGYNANSALRWSSLISDPGPHWLEIDLGGNWLVSIEDVDGIWEYVHLRSQGL